MLKNYITIALRNLRRNKLYSLINILADDYAFRTLGVTNKTHIVIKFGRRKFTDDTGKRTFAPIPKGLSGGGLWFLHNSKNIWSIASKEKDEKLVGLLIEWPFDKAVIIAVRFSFVLEAIKRFFPKLTIQI